MKKILLTSLFLFSNGSSFCQSGAFISTLDITHFWESYDSLVHARTNNDSIAIIQRLYLDRATSGFKDFIRVRNLTAKEYAMIVGRYPKFWSTIRPNTLNISSRQKEIEEVFAKFKNRYSTFRPPRVCFAIGCLRTGGTVSPHQILIGSEIAAADQSTDKTELRSWLQQILGSNSEVMSFIAHEAVHTQQRAGFRFSRQFRKSPLLVASIREGAADFVSKEVTNRNINQLIHAYGNEHLEDLKKEFAKGMNDKDLSSWLYNGSSAPPDRPADLGYFIGYKICEAYYLNAKDKRKALAELMQTGNPKRILKRSGFFSQK